MASKSDFQNVLSQFRTPQEIIAARNKTQMTRIDQIANIQDPKARQAAYIGEAVGMFFTGDDNKDPELAQARAVEDAKKVASSSQKTDGAEYEDSFAKRVDLLSRTATEMRSRGLDDQADLVESDADALRKQKLELRKLQAETTQTEKQTEHLDDAKDEYTRLMDMRSGLDTSTAVGAARFDDITKRMEKLTTTTGRTEFDMPFDKVQTREIQKNLFDNQDTLDSLKRAGADFKPEYLTLKGKVKGYALKMADIAGLPIDDKDKNYLRDYTAYKQSTVSNFNAYIHAMSGAQIQGAAEQSRLLGAVPNENDSPEQFKAKYENTIDMLEAVRLRTLDTLAAKDQPEALKIRTSSLATYQKKAREQRAAEQKAADPSARSSILDDILNQ